MRSNRTTDRSERGDRPRTKTFENRSAYGDQARSKRNTDRPSYGDQTRTRGRTPSNDQSGFVKIKQRDTREAGDARVTLTEKTQRAQMEWRQGRAGQMRLREKLKETSLAGWQRRKIELKLKLGADGWEPEKKIATSSMEKIRLLNSEFPKEWTIKHLSEQFKISQESVRRILKSKFQSSEEHTEQREHQRKLKIRAFKRSEKGGSK
ncbi:Required for respiratory growth protein 9 mitochondrial [Coemansia sp. RSA 1853]|nr:Required for respiratory growth protein 9 mitochondrial [Coemansia sp. RSA 1853]